jgi:hypothetical protein
MPSEIRVDASKNTSGLGTITYTNTGAMVSGVITASGPVSTETAPFYRNTSTISANYGITSAFNEMSVGPITINTGITVTVNTGATWTIV